MNSYLRGVEGWINRHPWRAVAAIAAPVVTLIMVLVVALVVVVVAFVSLYLCWACGFPLLCDFFGDACVLGNWPYWPCAR